jgi:hypothetical protein
MNAGTTIQLIQILEKTVSPGMSVKHEELIQSLVIVSKAEFVTDVSWPRMKRRKFGNFS